jgi:hypothetical protein
MHGSLFATYLHQRCITANEHPLHILQFSLVDILQFILLNHQVFLCDTLVVTNISFLIAELSDKVMTPISKYL